MNGCRLPPLGGIVLRPFRAARIAAGVVAFALCGVAPAMANSLVNLLQNPSAEQQPVTANGWTQASGNWTIPRGTDDGMIGTRTGANFFWGGQSAAAELYQEVDLAGYRAWLGDDGSRSALFVGYRGSWSGDGDTSRVVVEARSAAGTVLWSADAGAASPDTWSRVELKVVLPAGSARIRVRLLSTRVSGQDNNGYFDDVGLYLPPPNLLVNPGAELQPVTSNGWTAGSGDWTIPRGDDAGGIGTHSGNNFFWGGQSEIAEIVQEIDLSRYRGWIGDGTKTVEVAGYIGSFSGDDDRGTILVRLVDDQDVVLDIISLGPASPSVWQRFSQTIPLPATTAKIRVRLKGERFAGADNNAYFDDLGVYLPAINLLVNPGAELQPVTLNGWNPGPGDWTIPRGNDDGGIGTHSGSNFFWAGQSALGVLAQNVNLLGYRGWLGNGAQRAQFVAYKGSWSGDDDTAEVRISAFREGGGFTTDLVANGPSSPDVWTRVLLALSLPEWTALLDTEMTTVRVSGNDNNGYFDDLHLQIDAPDSIFDAAGVLSDGFEGASANASSSEQP